ncbi:PQQ-binding-like beta-propeller repeat protein [Halospeciosus flavus]|uniref:outer membrane protein assembly factor BamB family protein n=1 Tax=Halospeciosus flavus TaxID=3032283 RepID=UPI00361FA8CA
MERARCRHRRDARRRRRGRRDDGVRDRGRDGTVVGRRTVPRRRYWVEHGRARRRDRRQGSDTPTVRGRNVDTGDERWHHVLDADDNFVVAGGTTDRSTVYVTEFDGFVLALDAADGSVRWSRQFEDATRSEPVVAGDSLLVAGEGTLYALDRATGETRWTASGSGGIDRVHSQGDRVVVGTRLDEHRWRIRSLSLADGAERWTFTEEARQVWTTVGDVVAVGTSAGFLSVVE